jgi:hypothetical protein
MTPASPPASWQIDPAFVKALLNEDELGMVVRSHIYVESRINQYLELTTARPEYLEKLGLRYKQKVQLSCCLGFDPGFVRSLEVLGEIRNKFAHRIDTRLTDELVLKLYDSLPEIGRQMVEQSFSRTKDQLNAGGQLKVSELPAKDRFILITLSLERVVFAAIVLIENEQTHSGRDSGRSDSYN